MAVAPTVLGFRAFTRCALKIGVLMIAACGRGQPAPEFNVRGTNIVVDSAAPFTRHADFPARVESTLNVALKYWGGSWSDLEGKTVAFEGGQHVDCGSSPDAIGCYEGGTIRVSTQDIGSEFTCVEETVLVHEVGHAIIGDPDHTDPRWMDFSSVAQVLDGLPGYDASGKVPCRIFVNVWRHPPPSPST